MKKIIIICIAIMATSCTIGTIKNTKEQPFTFNTTTNTADKAKVRSEIKSEDSLSEFDYRFSNRNSVDNNYQKAINLLNSGKRMEGINILQSIVNNFPEYTPAKEILNRLESPFTLSASAVEGRLESWINAKSAIPTFNSTKPKTPALPNHPVLIKDEFETTANFKLRVKKAKEQYDKEVLGIKKGYNSQLKTYNKAVNRYNAKIEWERKTRAEKIPAMRKRYLDIAFAEALGNPLLSSLNYDADNEVFYGKITSDNNNLTLNVKIPVTLSEARNFKADMKQVKPSIKIDMIDGNIAFSKVSFTKGGKLYPAQLLSNEKILKAIPDITIGTQNVDIDNIQTQEIRDLEVQQIVQDNRHFFTPKI